MGIPIFRLSRLRNCLFFPAWQGNKLCAFIQAHDFVHPCLGRGWTAAVPRTLVGLGTVAFYWSEIGQKS